nr:hypothetical protein [Tanacetum cinerariifolium]
EKRLPLQRQRDAPVKEVCTAETVGQLSPQDDLSTGSTSEGSAKKKGTTVVVTTEDMQKRRNDVKARTTLLLALPDEHQLRFNKYKTVQELWAAILKTFSGNEATKKTKKNQLKQQYGNFKKFLTNLAPEWLMYIIVWRNRSDLDTMCLDDVYNHLKVYEPEVQKKSESNYQNMAFISAAKNSSGNRKVNTASIPTASTQVSPASANVATASISLDTACAYKASQSNGSQIKYEDINQIDEDDIKKMDIKPSPSIESNSNDLQNNSSSVSENEESTSSILSKPEIKFVKATDSPTASADESMLWHRRLGHLNFKTMNKLVRHNLVKGLPSKCFENDHTCTACLKGKQHKASCKSKLENSVSKPFHTLHMDLFGPTSGTIDQTLFIRKHRGDFLLVQVYAVDIIFGSSNPLLCREFEALMHDKFQMSAMGELNFFLGLQVQIGQDGPGKDVELHLYRSMIGSLMYLTGSRPDIMFAVCACARHQVTPKECHHHAVKRIFRYLKSHPKLGLWYLNESPFDLVAYSNSNYGGATQDRKSTTGGCQFLGRRLISWQCKKQIIVATSTTEAEYIAAASGSGQVLWIQNQLLDYGHHFIRDCFEEKLISVDHIHTDDNVVDLLTKPFDAGRFQIETTDAETKILTTIDGKLRTIFESSIRRNHKQNDEVGIYSLPDAELFETLTLMGLKSTGFNEFSSNIATAVGEDSGTPTEPHHTPTPEVQQSLPTAHSSPSLPPVTFETILTVIPTDTPSLRQYTRRAKRISQSTTLPTAADEPVSPLRDDSQGKALPTVSGLEAGQDRKNIIKTPVLPHDSTPRVTSLAADETEMATKIEAQDLEISQLKARIKLLEDKDGGGAAPSAEDAIIKGRSLETGEEAGVERSTERGSDDTEDLVNVLTSLDAANILTSRVQVVSIPPAGEVSTVGIPTGSGMVPTASLIFTTASVVTLYSRRKGKEKMVESETPKKKKLQEQKDIQMAREMEEQMSREDQRMKRLDKSNEVIARHLQEYEQASADLSIREKIELINELIEDFVPMGSKEEGERVKRKGLRLEQESTKKVKTSEEVSEEDLKEMMQLVQWKKCMYMLEHFDREDISQLWTLVKETLTIRQDTSDKKKELWVELKRFFEPDVEDQLEERFLLLRQRDAPAEEVCTADEVKHSDSGANSHVTPNLEVMDNTEAYYGDDALHVGNVSHLSPTSQTSPESSNGQPSPVSTTSIPTPPPSTPPPPPITRQRPVILHQNPKQRVPYNPSANHATVLPTTITEPNSFTIANNSLEWHQAMKEEYDALMKNGTWSLVPRASNTNVVDGKWVYRLKQDKNGAITRYKARFVAKCFRQQPGIYFHETFSLVAKLITIRSVLSLEVTKDWPLRQLNIQNAFLHGNLKEQVYMKQPLGFIDPQRPNHVCLLYKSLYGLKQAPRAWFERLSTALFDLGFKGSKTDLSLFIYLCGDTLLCILVYVDDIIITSNNKGTIDNIIYQLRSAFALIDLGPLKYFLGIEIVPHVSSILLSQKKYILELLQSAGLSNCNPVSSLMVTSSSLSLDDIKRILHRSSSSTFQAFTNVLWIGNPDTSLEAFLDADWAGDLDDRWSTRGFAIYLGSNLISWTARKQHDCLTQQELTPPLDDSGVLEIFSRRRKFVNYTRDLNSLIHVHLMLCNLPSIPKSSLYYSITGLESANSESRPPMLNKENYVPWSSRLLRYAKSRPNEKLIHKSILNSPYVRKMISEPSDANREITVTETFHLQTDDELSDKELKQIEADAQAIQTILLGLPEDIYVAVDSCETA